MSAAELYLIAHKVRGEPAFDVATRIAIGDEEGWIIPTSGHRAYPFAMIPFDTIGMRYAGGMAIEDAIPPMPADLEDHYPANPAAASAKPSAASLLAALGLGRPKVTIQRRV